MSGPIYDGEFDHEQDDLLGHVENGFNEAYGALSRIQCRKLWPEQKLRLRQELESMKGRMRAVEIDLKYNP